MTLREGDRIWQAFVHASILRINAEVRTLTVCGRADEETVAVRCNFSGEVRLVKVRDIGDVYCESEADAWEACELGLRRVATECIAQAERCVARRGVARGVA